MEFRCRLGTDTGEVIEETRVADSESTLRKELEAKGLYILSLSPQGGWFG
jgi:type II secretory pathway component PulF